MATRFYLSTAPYTANSPAFSGSWDSTANMVRRKMSATKDLTALANKSAAVGGVSGNFHGYVQFVSPPVDGAYNFAASTVTNSIVMRWAESDSLANCFMQTFFKIVSEDGTVQRDAAGFNTDATEIALTTLTARTFTATTSLMDYTTVAGDRLVIEVGFQKNSSTSYTITTNYGNDAANDLTISTSDTGADNPWFETELNLGFLSEGAIPNQLMMTGVGT
jgi:hypothetical protein